MICISPSMPSCNRSPSQSSKRGGRIRGSRRRSADPRPRDGELLAAASHRRGWRGSVEYLAAATEPYEAGSTLKPFTLAALLAEGLATLTDSVDTGAGIYRTAGRTIHDETSHGWLTLEKILAVSSNVGMAKFAERLPEGVQFSYLRDFGFGTPRESRIRPSLRAFAATLAVVCAEPCFAGHRLRGRGDAASVGMAYGTLPTVESDAASARARGAQPPGRGPLEDRAGGHPGSCLRTLPRAFARCWRTP